MKNNHAFNKGIFFFLCLTLALPAFASETVTRSKEGVITHENKNQKATISSPYRQVPGEILVRYKPSSSDYSRETLQRRVGARVVRKFQAVRGLHLLKLSQDVSMIEALRTFGRSDDVLYAEPNYIVRSFAAPNDAMYSQLWGLNNTGQTGGTSGADINAPEAWNLTTGSTEAVIVVIDTGVDYTHTDLASNIYMNTADCNSNNIDDDSNGYIDDCYGINALTGSGNPMDDHGHGTHVAGTIGAVGNNASGVAGVNWSASIMACKFLDADGYGDTAGAIACLDYIAMMKDRGVNIVASNNSWGGGAYSQALIDAIDTQRERGILFIVAAGNDDSDNEIILSYPCSYSLPNIICVAATDHNDNLCDFSNYGKRIVHLAAPGESIVSTIPGNSYATADGTSMATPHVTGVAGLAYAHFPGADWRAVKNRIIAGGDIKASLNQTIANRRLNAYGALTCTNSIVQARVKPIGASLTVGVGAQVELAALHINCAVPNGNINVTISPGSESVTLLDNGLNSDLVAGDGIYTGQWTPSASGTFTLTFPGSDTVTVEVDPYLQAGFPVKAWHGAGQYHGGPANHTLVTNVDGTSGLQIFVSSQAQGPLNAWDSAGQILPGWPADIYGTPYPVAARLSEASVGNDIFVGIYGGDDGDLAAYNGAGQALEGWPLNSANYIATPGSAADVDGDGLDEIFIEEEDWKLHAYKADGSVLSGWPVYQAVGGQERHTGAIADLDGDGDLEIVTASGSTTPGVSLFAYHHNGTVVTGFPVTFNGCTDTFPVIGDVDNDGQKEIVVIGKVLASVWSSHLLIYSNAGVLKNSVVLSGYAGYGTAPALADLDDDGTPEIIVQTDTALNVVRGNGTNYPGWPVIWGGSYSLGGSAPVAGDVDGDGVPEIVVTTQVAGSLYDGVVRVFKRDGSSHPVFPRTLPISSSMVPAIADIDDDGRNEIIISGDYWNGDPGYYDKVWVYDLGGTSHGRVLWGQFMGNAKHTGTALTVESETAKNDLNGDGVTDIIWNHTDGRKIIYFMNEAGAVASQLTIVRSSDMEVEDVGDFNGDGVTDIIWNHTDGRKIIYFMNEAGAVASQLTIVRSSDMEVEDRGDFNGDGVTDIIWNHTDGRKIIYFMNDQGAVASQLTVVRSADMEVATEEHQDVVPV